jgi:ABC-2 type transport system permease protein
MISTIMKISLISLRRDRVAFGMTFVLPVIFFSIFAMIFGATDTSTKDNKMKVVVADRDQTDISRRFIAAIQKQGALDVSTAPDEESAKKQVHDGKFAVAVIVLKGFAASFGNFAADQDAVDLVYDAANPIAQNAVGGLLQAAAMSTAPDLLITRGFSSLESLGAGMTPRQSAAIDNLRPYLRGEIPWSEQSGGTAAPPNSPSQGMLRIHSVDVRANEAKAPQQSMVSYYAAGTGVMFLMFSMAAGGGALLDETESGTLERLLSTNVSMSQVLAAKWLYLTLVGIMQICIMFLWAALVFHLQLFTAARFSGFAAMAVTTAAAASAFGLVLATACKTRAQLSGVSSIIILIMSALGGSMVPRFIMPKFMNTTALFTLNGWALDGFLKVFWYGETNATVAHSLVAVSPQVAMLAAIACVLLGIARSLARRWETI